MRVWPLCDSFTDFIAAPGYVSKCARIRLMFSMAKLPVQESINGNFQFEAELQ